MPAVEEMPAKLETALDSQGFYLRQGVFLAVFSEDRLSFFEENKIGFAKAYILILQANQVAFAGAGLRIVGWVMIKLSSIEIGFQLAVDAVQQVDVKPFGDTCLIVVRGQNGAGVFCQVKAGQQQIAGRKLLAYFLAKQPGSFNRKIADVGAQEHHQLFAF